ncbi:hypothetical protein [Mycolicibacterium sp. D5.8-2]|uniref:hypothetical protein n=1 Tax=Mycolicibacterium sp. D5.8-2 TaxID=3085903 RepID=UPI00298C3279|nr:hypothetical protein [Mycolicibacterium sp. D5.8-2]MDW5614438.1 hypothetical protein [Mycolicibacterium sp. D5.8-2]
MGVVLGLSLTTRAVVWVLVDDTDGSMIDHDVLQSRADTEIAGAAARGAQVIAAAGGHHIERVRLTWTDDVAEDAMELRTRLDRTGFAEVATVPLDCAGSVEVDPDATPGLALAYGAALADITPADPVAVPARRRVRARRGVMRIAVAVLGAAAAAAVGGLLLTSGSVSPVQETAVVGDQPAPSGPGWVAVRAPSDGAAHPVRKVVEPTEGDDTEAWAPQPAVVAPVAVPLAVPAEEPVPEPLPAAQAHLSGEWPGPATVVTAVPALPEMTDPANLFTALP